MNKKKVSLFDISWTSVRQCKTAQLASCLTVWQQARSHSVSITLSPLIHNRLSSIYFLPHRKKFYSEHHLYLHRRQFLPLFYFAKLHTYVCIYTCIQIFQSFLDYSNNTFLFSLGDNPGWVFFCPALFNEIPGDTFYQFL
jgi:hypothetical protein